MNAPIIKDKLDEFGYVIIWLTCEQICFGFYDGIGRELPGGIFFFGNLLLFWLVANWVINDVKRTEVTWISDSRFTLLIAWPILVPIYLFQTRKLKGLKEISCYLAFWLFFRIFGIIIGKLTAA